MTTGSEDEEAEMKCWQGGWTDEYEVDSGGIRMLTHRASHPDVEANENREEKGARWRGK